jgi:hypothetical protein
VYWYINLFYRDEIFDEMMIESEEEEDHNDLELELQTKNANNWKNKFSCEVSNVQFLICIIVIFLIRTILCFEINLDYVSWSLYSSATL